MSYGQSVYGVGVYDALTPAKITKFTQFSASGQYAIDDLHIVNVTLDASQIESIYRSSQPQQRGINTVILAPFDGNTEAGDIDFGGLTIVGWNVYRDSNIIAEYPNVETTSLEHIDHSVVAKESYTYAVRPVANNGVIGDSTETRIIAQYDGYWLVDPDNPDDVLFQFKWNTDVGTIPYEESRAEIRTFAEKPRVRYGQYNAERGTIGGLLDNRDDYLKLKEIIRQKRALLLKTWRGDAWRVNVYNLQRTPDVAGEYLSVDWVEVAE